MALARIKTWAKATLTYQTLNAEFNNILNGAISLISPLTGDLALGGNSLTGVLKLNSAVLAGTIYNGSATWDPGTVVVGDIVKNDIAGVTGAAIGDFVMVSTTDASYDNAKVHLFGRVTATDEVQICIHVSDQHSGSFAPGSGDYFFRVFTRA